MPHPAPPTVSMPTGTSAYLLLGGVVAVLAGYWNVFLKAGRKGWESLVPGWNVIALMKIIGRPWWWSLGLLPAPAALWAAYAQVYGSGHRVWWLLALPGLFVTGWVHCKVSRDLAKSFGRSRQFALRMTLLPFVFVPWLGFDYSEYRGPGATMKSKRSRKKE